MASGAAPRGGGRPGGRRVPPAATAPAPPPLWPRVPWALAPLVAALALAAHTWFRFVGEPVADDFDFLHHTFLSGGGDWLDGGGGHYYWRPLARQLFYRALGGVMLAHPAWIAVLQTALAALAGVLLYRTLRRHWPGAWAAAAGTFPVLMEAGRALLSTPTNVQDLGAILFSALALHEASRSRLASALGALLAALLCKEMAVVTAAALPFMPALPSDAPARGRSRETRLRWAGWAAALVLAWGVTYWLVIRHAGLLLARDATGDARSLATPWPVRYLWACRESLADAMSLPALSPGVRTAAMVALAAVAGAALVILATDRLARARVRGGAPWIVGGLAWFALATATLADVHPDWRPYRSPFGALGLGVASTALLGALRPALLAALVLVRLATFALCPGPPQAIGPNLARGYSLDFAKLVQLQRLVGETRQALAVALPPPAREARVAAHYYPVGALHAFADDRALQTWYRDTSLHWVPVEAAINDERRASVIALQFQPTPPRQVVPVNPLALWQVELGARLIDVQRWDQALRELAVAESLARDPAARMLASMVAGKRALALVNLGRLEEADRSAGRALALWSSNTDARYARVGGALSRGRLLEAEADLDTLVRAHPESARLREMLMNTRRARLAEGR